MKQRESGEHLHTCPVCTTRWCDNHRRRPREGLRFIATCAFCLGRVRDSFAATALLLWALQTVL